MPTYQYECRHCKNELEVVQKMDEEPLVHCPKCNNNELFRVLTGGLGFFFASRTVGAVVDKNTDKFSSDFKEHLTEKNRTNKVDKLSDKLKSGQNIEKPKKSKTVPWHKKNQTVSDKQLKSASADQLKTYIEKGHL